MFGPNTEGHLRRYQKTLGLVVDGVAGQVTKYRLSLPRHDFSKDLFAENDAPDIPWEDKSTIKYSLGISPGYLDRTQLLKEIGSAFQAWSDLLGLEAKIEAIDKEDDAAHVRIRFVDFALKGGSSFALDRPGRELATARADFIHFDASEKWSLQGDAVTNGNGSFMCMSACIHQVGHVFGFGHVADEKSVMHALYSPDKTELTTVDEQLLVSRASF